LPAEVEVVRRDPKAASRLSVIFGVKEAVMKALGTGMRGVGWKEIDTLGAEEGEVGHLLSARALGVARRLGATRYSFSVTRSPEIVLAAVLLSDDGKIRDQELG
jgi:holo-[acyl-carrier protein] synthase